MEAGESPESASTGCVGVVCESIDQPFHAALPRQIRVAAYVDRALEYGLARRDIFHAKVDIDDEVADFLHPAHADAFHIERASNLQFAAVARIQILRAGKLGDHAARGGVIGYAKKLAIAQLRAQVAADEPKPRLLRAVGIG